jgi:nucleoside-diphosphate-sugar epimerase
LPELLRISNAAEKMNISFEQGSIADLSLIRQALEGADGIVHEAAIISVQYSVQNHLENHEVNSTGT